MTRRHFQSSMLARVGDKWTVVVVGVLAHGPMRYSHIFSWSRVSRNAC